MRITVLLGGTSSERDVSLASGLRIAEALRARGHEVSALDTAKGPLTQDDERRMLAGGAVKTKPPTPEELRRMRAESVETTAGRLPKRGECDVAFLALHGGSGEDGTIQALLDLAGVPYTGSGHLASALAMDKDLSKHVLRAQGVRTADWIMAMDPASPPGVAEVEKVLGWPVIVKPSKQGSTVGLSIVKQPGELAAAIAEAFRHDDEVMIERFIAGRELSAPVIGGDALPVGEIIPKHEIYDYECKYTPGMAQEIFPAPLTPAETAEVQAQAVRAFNALKLRGCARIDFRMTAAGEFYCLEANTLPGMTATSLVPQGAAAAGIEFADLCERIARLAVDHAAAHQAR
ncbi:MAG: D-alanine--D-alanine ligase [Gemmatimonadetes bacterium]|jgi:D-alanine-D-alanine ligase|nr:D-alanine--D-alanine ligase [Gemmatimonadota bacterium]